MEEAYYPDINRAAMVVRLKKPFIDWLVYSSKKYNGLGRELRPEEIKTDGFDSKHVYLVPAYDKIEKYEKYIKKHCTEIFEEELFGWYTDPEMWPKDRSWKVFKEWFDYEIHTMVFDTDPDNPIEHEE